MQVHSLHVADVGALETRSAMNVQTTRINKLVKVRQKPFSDQGIFQNDCEGRSEGIH